MSVATRQRHWLARALNELPAGERVVATGISWDEYVWLCEHRDQSDRQGVRIRYDRGRIELMAPSLLHEKPLDRLKDVVKVLCEELDLPCLAVGTTTLRRADLLRGLEPDGCFYLTNAPIVVGRDVLDLSAVPPPDLAIEVDVTNSSVRQQPIYADLRVPELWRHDAGVVTFLALGPGGYTETAASLAFPSVTDAAVMRLLVDGAADLDVPFIRRSRQWVRTLSPQP